MIQRVITTIFAKGLSAVFNFLLVMFTAYFMGASIRGEFALIILAVSIVNMVQDIGGGAAFSYFTPQVPFYKLIRTVVPWVICWALILPPILDSFNLIPRGTSIYVILLALLQGMITLFQNYLIGIKHIYGFNIIELTKSATVLLTFLVIHYFAHETTILTLLNAYLSGFSFTLTLAVILILTRKKKLFIAPYEGKLPLNLYRYGIEIQANNFAQLLNYRLLYFFIEKVEGLAVLGVFSVAVSIAETLWVMCRSIASLQYSKLINCKDKAQKIALTNLSARLSAFATTLGLLFLIIIPQRVYAALFGQSFEQVASVIPYLGTAILTLAIFTVFNHYFSANNRNKVNILGSVLGNVILISTAYPLIINWGIYGAAFAYSLTHFGMLIFFYATYKSQTHSVWTDFIPKRNDLSTLSKTTL